MAHPTNTQAWHEANKLAGWKEDRLPLPGIYPCLTMQANVTLHKPSGMGKFVIVVREPTEQYEVARMFSDLQPWLEVRETIADQLVRALGSVSYLMGFGASNTL